MKTILAPGTEIEAYAIFKINREHGIDYQYMAAMTEIYDTESGYKVYYDYDKDLWYTDEYIPSNCQGGTPQ
jgi:hypothetical protein